MGGNGGFIKKSRNQPAKKKYLILWRRRETNRGGSLKGTKEAPPGFSPIGKEPWWGKGKEGRSGSSKTAAYRYSKESPAISEGKGERWGLQNGGHISPPEKENDTKRKKGKKEEGGGRRHGWEKRERLNPNSPKKEGGSGTYSLPEKKKIPWGEGGGDAGNKGKKNFFTNNYKKGEAKTRTREKGKEKRTIAGGRKRVSGDKKIS